MAEPSGVRPAPVRRPGPWRVAVPEAAQLGELDEGWDEAFRAAAERLAAAGAELVGVDLAPFSAAARMLYGGAFVAERYTAVGRFVDEHAGAADLDPTVAGIITASRGIPAHRLFADLAELERLRGLAAAALGDADALLLPTAPGHPTLAEVATDPVGANARLGRFTNSANLLDMCAVAAPAGHVGGLPFGVMLVGPAATEHRLASIARLLAAPAPVRLAVVGAHLSGQPLNGELLALGARPVAVTTTAADYRMHLLDTVPPKPGLVRVAEGGAAVEAEVWELPAASLGALLAALPAPMALGRVRLADGTSVPGFLCEPAALDDAPDITAHGGWRGYLATTVG